MKIKEISIKHFRGIEDLTLKLNGFTVLIGKNGVGKSSILHALNFFREPNYKLKSEDYYKRELNRSIEVSLVFDNLSSEEKSEFSYYVQNNELKVIKISVGDEINDILNVSQKYYGERLQHRDFLDIRRENSKTEKKRIYHQLLEDEKYNSMPNIGRSSVDLIEKHLIKWEEDHAAELESIMDEGQFFGWKGVGAGKLNKFMRFFFIPAVHEYSEEEKAEKSAYLNEILDLTIRRRIIETPELKEFKESTLNKYKELVQSENESIVQELSSELSQRLNKLSPGCSLFINYQPGDVNFIETRYGTELQEYGFRGPISSLGHGVQRTSFFTLLTYLGEQQVINKALESGENGENNETSQENKFLILFIIEEPELYQHPNRIRLIKKILQDLTQESDDSTYQFQIICSSHSPYLIDIQDVEVIKIMRKIKNNSNYEVSISKVQLDKVAQELKVLHRLPGDTRCDAMTLKSRLKAIMTLELSEGFFADKVILVEGLEDKAVIQAIDQYTSKIFDSKGIVVIPVIGKNNLDRPALIFQDLGIPVYLIFDTDSDCKPESRGKNEKTNKILKEIMGETDFDNLFDTGIEGTYASLDPNITKLIKNAVGDALYTQIMDELKEEYGFKEDQDCRKNYIVMTQFIQKVYDAGKNIPELEEIIQKIYDL